MAQVQSFVEKRPVKCRNGEDAWQHTEQIYTLRLMIVLVIVIQTYYVTFI